MVVVVLRAGDPLRAEAEALARRMFRLRHGAEVSHLPPRLLAALSPAGRPVAVAGLRDCADGFFSESYLDRPVEREIGAAAGAAPLRESVLELTALAAERTAPLLCLFRAAVGVGVSEGREWGLFTATAAIRGMASRLGLPLLELAVARRERMSAPGAWGAYYEQDPRVCAVALDRAMAQLSVGAALAAAS